MSEYLKLAEKIADDIDGFCWICTALPENEAMQFEKMFMPTQEIKIKYNHKQLGWMGENGKSWNENNNLRILALCLMHEISLTENKVNP